LQPEERKPMYLLYVLYVCALWRGEVELRISSSLKVSKPTARTEMAGGLFIFFGEVIKRVSKSNI
jgi:hypothetical protein